MTRNLGTIVAVAAVVALTLGLAACGTATTAPSSPDPRASATGGPTNGSPAADDPTGSPAAGTSAAVAWEALLGPDGEYAAAASYAAVIDTFGSVEPYVSIKAAEERHISALIRQLDRLSVDAPANPYLGGIAAPADLATAAQAWADGEVANVAMYDELLARTTDAGLTRVLTNLRRASLESHLPLFEAAAANGGTLSAEQMAALGFGH